jgi:hypothetical protein
MVWSKDKEFGNTQIQFGIGWRVCAQVGSYTWQVGTEIFFEGNLILLFKI